VDNSRNYLSKLLRYSRLLDAENSVTDLDEFVSITLRAWETKVPFGTYNVTNPGSVTTREVVELIRANFKMDREFHFFRDEAEFMEVAAATPRSNCVLSTDKLKDVSLEMTEVREALERALRTWRIL
jgi:dTDP-4-dehydrorhamnose reductase